MSEGKDLFELGKRGPYHRFINFPVELPKYVIPEGNTTESVFFTGNTHVWRSQSDEVPPLVTPSESVLSSHFFKKLKNVFVSPEAMADIKSWDMEMESQNTKEKKCNCDIVSLMRDGCKCGGK